MQTLISESDPVEFIAFVNLSGAPSGAFDYISKEKDKEYESILLDKQGSLAEGLSQGKTFLRVFSRKGRLIHAESFQSVQDSDVIRLFDLIRKERP
ncbi:hypothetical protein [Leptospira perolatii]|nr:hypothetical protein [Leptospira perolatii]